MQGYSVKLRREMQQQYIQENVIGIKNAPWWLNHSHVEIREDMLAEDQEWIANNSTSVVNPGTEFARVEVAAGSTNLLLVQRMVVSGVVAVQRPNGRVKTVELPGDTPKLLAKDLEYIVTQINAANELMTTEQKEDFLPSASAPSKEN